MKTVATALTFILWSIGVFGQVTHQGLPVLKTNSLSADFRIGNDWERGNWTISPQIEFDSLVIELHSESEEFGFYTDTDSISFTLLPQQLHKFYVLLGDSAFALTIVEGIRPNHEAHEFDTASTNKQLKFWFEQDNDYLKDLRSKYPLDSLIRQTNTDLEQSVQILHWVHNRWKHDGSNKPQKSDAISILEEAKQGKNFRCVEYGIVAAACLNAVGLKARTLALKTKDVETTQYGAGHVLLEVYLNDLKKWALLDGQWDVMPTLNGVPLNAVEFQKAIVDDYKGIQILTSSTVEKRHYIDWIFPYLYYFDVSFDNASNANVKRRTVNGKRSLMLVPIGADNPTIFQINDTIDYCIYTHSLNDFYASPAEN